MGDMGAGESQHWVESPAPVERNTEAPKLRN
jgi:hypothetical protein